MRARSDYENAKFQGRLWTPALLGGALAGWYDAADRATLVLSSSTVSTLKDKSRFGRDLSHSATLPAWSETGLPNGVPAISFDSSDDGLYYASTAFLPANSIINAFFVGTVGSATSNSRVFSINTTGGADFGGSTGYIPILQQGGLGFLTAFNQSQPWGSLAPFTYDDPVVYGSVFTTTTQHTSFLNGLAASAVGSWSDPCTSIDRWSIGQRDVTGGADNLTGKIAELVAVTGMMALADVYRVLGYLAWKAKMSHRLRGLPYISAPPLIGS